jgi:hypothetical protein
LLNKFKKRLHLIALYSVGVILFIIGHIKFKVFTYGLEQPPENKAIMTTNNHQRDWDIVLLNTAFLFTWRKWKNIDKLTFAGRDDLFFPAYFAKHTRKNIFFPISFFLFHLNLEPILRYLNGKPIRKLDIRNLSELLVNLEIIIGDKPVAEALIDGWQSKYPYLFKLYKKKAAKGKELKISGCFRHSILKDLKKKATYDEVKPEIRTILRVYINESIKESLNEFSEIIKDGSPLYYSVEGELTHDGLFRTFKAGFARIIENVGNIMLVPLNISYDFMQKGRPSVFLQFGKAVNIAAGIRRQELKKFVEQVVMKLQTATMTSLISLAVIKIAKGYNKCKTDFCELLNEANRILDIYKRSNCFIDQRLNSLKYFEKRLKKAIIWGEKKGLWKSYKHEGELHIKFDIRTLNENKPGPWPDVNYIKYAANQIPESIALEYMGLASE